jgi:hypothetical protein
MKERRAVEAGPRAESREALERVARCVAMLVYYHRDGGSWAASQLLHEEAPALGSWLSSCGPEGSLRARVLSLILSDLRDRYDEAVARRLHGVLVRSLEEVAGAACEAETPRLDRRA